MRYEPQGDLRDALSKCSHKCGSCLSSSSALSKKLKKMSFLAAKSGGLAAEPLPVRVGTCLSESPCPDPVVTGSRRWGLQKQSPLLMSAQNQAWEGPLWHLEAKLKAPSAHLCPKELEGEEKPQHCMATRKERLPQPQGGEDADTGAG